MAVAGGVVCGHPAAGLPRRYRLSKIDVLRSVGRSFGWATFRHPGVEGDFRGPSPTAWVFPSEKLTTPVRKDNCWRRHFAPQLKNVGLEWVNFQVMRRTHRLPLKGTRRGPASPGRADGAHRRCESKLLYQDFAPAPPRCGQQAGGSPNRQLIGANWSQSAGWVLASC